MIKKPKIMVCVTGSHTCDRLIARGVERGSVNKDSELHIVHCVQTGHNFMGTPFESDAIEYLFTAAQIAGGELSLLRADDVDDALVGYAKEHDVNIIIMGVAVPQNKVQEPINVRLQRRLPDVEFDITSGGAE